jgi:hypothetical protein
VNFGKFHFIALICLIIKCFLETHQILYELFFGYGFDSPSFDAITREVSGNTGRKVADFDVLGVQEISAKKM